MSIFQVIFKWLPILILCIPTISSAQVKLRPSKSHSIEQVKAADYNLDGNMDYILLECQNYIAFVNYCRITLLLVDPHKEVYKRKTITSGLLKANTREFFVGDFNNDQRPDVVFSQSDTFVDHNIRYPYEKYFLISNGLELPTKPKFLFKIPWKNKRTKIPPIKGDFNGDTLTDLGYMNWKDQFIPIFAQTDGSFIPSNGFFVLYNKNYKNRAINIKYKGYRSKYEFLNLRVFSVFDSSDHTHKKARVYYTIDNGLNSYSGKLIISDLTKLDLGLQKKLAQIKLLNAKEIETLLNAVDSTPSGWEIEAVISE